MGTVTRTVVFTDLANYTAAVSRADRAGLRKLLDQHQALVGPIVERNGGRVVKNLGDSFMCLFRAATDALRAALDVQHVVTGDEISLRLGMTTGDVEEIEGDAFGEAANLAHRILAKTPAGEIWFGPGTRVCMNASEIPWEMVGRFNLKGIPGEKDVFRAIPKHRCWLPEPIAAAARSGNLVRIRRGDRPPLLPADPVILLEGFQPGSEMLDAAVDGLPVLDPASLWLAAYNIASEDRNVWREAGRGLVVGTPQALERSLQEAVTSVIRPSGSDTIVLEMGVEYDLELLICGLALPQVPLSGVVAGYFYDLLPDGRWVTRSERALLRVEVSPSGTRVQAQSPGITVDGRGIRSGEWVELIDGGRIGTPAGVLEFRMGSEIYAGFLLADTEMRLSVVKGQTAELGREPQHPGLPFPDRKGQDNIRWCPGPRAARARSNGFTIDRVLAGRHQAAVQVLPDAIQLMPLHKNCPTYILKSDRSELERCEQAMPISLNDLVVAGTAVVGLRAPEKG